VQLDKKPCGVQTFSSFVVDLLKDLAADDNGVWTTSTPRHMYEVERKNGKILSLCIVLYFHHPHGLAHHPLLAKRVLLQETPLL
jgi:hypothetical protein